MPLLCLSFPESGQNARIHTNSSAGKHDGRHMLTGSRKIEKPGRTMVRPGSPVRNVISATGPSGQTEKYRATGQAIPPLQPVETIDDYPTYLRHLFVGDGQRRRDTEGGIAEKEPVAQDAALLEKLHYPVEFPALAELHSQQQTAATDALHGGVTAQQRLEKRPLRSTLPNSPSSIIYSMAASPAAQQTG